MHLYAAPNNYVIQGNVTYDIVGDTTLYVSGKIQTQTGLNIFHEIIELSEKVLLSRSYSVQDSEHWINNYLIKVKQVGCASVKVDFSRADGMFYGDALLDTRDIKIGIFRIDLYTHNKDDKEKKIRLVQDPHKAKK